MICPNRLAPSAPTSPRATESVMPRRISTGPALPMRLSLASVRSRTGSVMRKAFSRIVPKGIWAAAGHIKSLLIFPFLAMPAIAEEVTILALGDSLTQGYGLPAEAGLVPQLQGWMQARGADVKIINAGVSGDTTRGGLNRVDWSLTDEVDAVMIALGGNDLLRGIPLNSIEANLEQIIQKVKAKTCPSCWSATAPPRISAPNTKAPSTRCIPASPRATPI